MKSYLRYLSLLLCLVLSLSLFSLTVSAEIISHDDYHLYTVAGVNIGGSYHPIGDFSSFPGNGTIEMAEKSLTISKPSFYGFYMHYSVAHNNKSVLFDGNIKTTIKLENVYFSLLQNVNGNFTYYRDLSSIYLNCHYVDGTTESFQVEFQKSNNVSYSFKSTFTPSKDVVSISFITGYDTSRYYNADVIYTAYFGEYNGDESCKLTIQQPSEEAGLLSGILGWVQNIFNKVSDGFENVGQGITNVFNSILELPSKLWNLIEEGLKALFVPSEDDMIAYKDRWQELLADRLGAVYQVTEIIFGAWDEIQVAQETKTIDIPSTTIPLPQGNSFTFGGYSVRIVPEGFEWLATSLKLIIGVLCTFLFINALRHRYDEVMGVEK